MTSLLAPFHSEATSKNEPLARLPANKNMSHASDVTGFGQIKPRKMCLSLLGRVKKLGSREHTSISHVDMDLDVICNGTEARAKLSRGFIPSSMTRGQHCTSQ